MKTGSSCHRRWTNTRIEREVDPHRARWLYGGLLGLVVAVLPAVAWVLQQNECLQLSYELTSIRTQCDRLHEQERRLQVERAELESLARVEVWAVAQHGLQLPDAERVVVVQEFPAPSHELVARVPTQQPDGVR